MSEADYHVTPDSAKPPDAPCEEDAESAWLLARRKNQDVSPPSPRLAREHAQLETLLENLPSMRVDDSWHDAVLHDASRTQQRAMRTRWAAALLAVVAIGGGAVLWKPLPVREPVLALEVRPKQVMRGNDRSASIGDDLIVTARTDADSELRVYHNGTRLLARCPGDSRCRHPHGRPTDRTLELSLDRPGNYDIILVLGDGGAFPDASTDQYLSAAITAKAQFMSRQVLVR